MIESATSAPLSADQHAHPTPAVPSGEHPRPSDGRSRRRERNAGGRPLRDALFIALFIALAAALASQQRLLEGFDWAVYDGVLDLIPLPATAPPLVVAIDERSIEAIGPWPWPRRVYAGALRRLHDLGAERIAIDVLMTAGPPAAAADDAVLAAAIAEVGEVYMPVVIDEQQASGQLLEVLPAAVLLDAGAKLGHVHVEASDDGVVRGVYLWQGIDHAHWPHLALALATAATPRPRDDADAPMSLANVRSDFVLLRFAPHTGAIPRVSFVDLLNGRVEAQAVRGRAVFIGMTAAAGADTIATPVTREGRPMAGVDFNSNLYSALREDAVVLPLAAVAAALLSALLAALPLLLLPSLRPRQGLLVTITLAGLPVLVSLVLLAAANRWFPPVAASAGALLLYPLWSWRRLDQTLRSVRAEILALGEATRAARLAPDSEHGTGERSFIAALLPARIEADGTLTPLAPLDARSERWLASFRASAIHRPATPRGSFEVLSRGLNDLHASVERQNESLEVARRGLGGMRDGVVLLGAWGQVLFLNDAARKLLGIAADIPTHDIDLLALLVPIVPAGGREWRELLRALYLEERADTVEARLGSPEGQGRGELLVGLSRHDAGAVLTFVDISRLRQAERAHRETLGFLSHDLRSPIVSLLALGGSLRDRHPDPDVQDTLGRIQRYAQRSLENAEQFLQMARIENEPDVQMYELDLLGAAENAAAQLLDQAEAQGSRIIVTTTSTEGLWVFANGEFIERAIVNLISNALKYGPAGDTIDVEVREDGDRTVCDVHDNGPGIPEGDVEQLFSPWFQGQAHRGRRDGVGLGLRFVQVVAERHRGRVRVRSAPGEGTTFSLSLPSLQLD